MKILENICIAVSGIILMITFMGICVERFQYIYDGFFNTYGLFMIIAVMGIMIIPYIVFYIQIFINNFKKR